MAPEKKTASTQGKTRLYNCAPCGMRHAPPTGLACPHQPRRSSTVSTAGPMRTRSSATKTARSAGPVTSAAAHVSSTRRVGRPPRVQPQPDSETDSDCAELPVREVCPHRKRPREYSPESSTPVAKRRPIPAPRGVLPNTGSLRAPETGAQDPPSPSQQMMQSVLSQMSALQESNRLECQNLAEQQERDRQMFMQSIAAVTAKVDALHAPPVQPSVASRAPTQTQASVSTAPTVVPSHGQVPAARQSLHHVSLASTSQVHGQMGTTPITEPVRLGQQVSGPVTTNEPMPSTSDHIPPVQLPRSQAPMVARSGDQTVTTAPPNHAAPASISPQQLQDDPCPVRSLRRDEASANMADHLMKVVGILEDGAQGNKSKTGFSKHSIRKKLAKWPSDYVYRWSTDEPPTFDSLSVPEFMAGYLSIFEESLPVIAENAPAITHIHYVRHLMDNCPSLGWEAARTAHKHVLLAIEYKRLVWADTEGVYKAKADALYRYRHSQQSMVNMTNMPCPAFQNDTCPHEDDHATDTHTLLHYCSHCYSLGKTHVHPLSSCHKVKKGKESSKLKNGRGHKAKKAE